MTAPLFLLPTASLPSEGFDFPSCVGARGPARLFAQLGEFQPFSPEHPVSDFTLLRLSGQDDSGAEIFPFSLHPEAGPAETLEASLHSWLSPLGLAAIPFGRTAGEVGETLFSGIAIATPAFLEELHEAEQKLNADGWRFAFPEGEVGGRGLKEIAFAGLLGLSLTATGARAAATETSPRTEQSANISASLFRTDEALLAVARQPGANLSFVVDLSAQRAYLLVNGEIAVETRVCTGRPGKRTPTGTFRIGEKVRNGKISTIYKVPLPYWMRLTDNGIGLHVGEVLDSPSSAGCVRLPAGIAATLFDHLPRATEVRIVESVAPDLHLALDG